MTARAFLLLAATLLAGSVPAQPVGHCLAVEVSAVGRGAHGSTVMRDAAPHRLIRALDRLPEWRAATPGVGEARIVDLEAAPAINVIPPRATARVQVVHDGGATSAALIGDLGRALGSAVEVRLDGDPCGDAR
jgi:hypothetical protein